MTDRMVAQGRVLAARADGRLTVELLRQDACPGCRCGRLAMLAGKPRAELLLGERSGSSAGDHVAVTMPASAVLRASLCVYGLPTAGLLAGATVAAVAGFGDLGCLAGAVVGLCASLLALRGIQRRWYSDAASGLRVVSIA